ncbi:MAG: hypothetical protein JKX83_09745 [Pseudomonadales bacterium]|nr:hypothetical protein [Pseudomonadales bacterium]
MTANIPGLGGHKPTDNNRPNTERRTTRVNGADGIRYFTNEDGEVTIDRRKSSRRRNNRLDRRLLKAGMRATKATTRRNGPRERRRKAAASKLKAAQNQRVGRSVNRNI